MKPQTLSELKSNCAIIILAAGSSSRMGQSKQLLEIENTSLLRKSALTALACEVKNIYVVLGANAEAHQTTIADLPIQIVINNEWKNGMGSSLKKGLSAAITVSPTVAGIIILVCDQPMLTSQHLNNILEKYAAGEKGIVASNYNGTTGVPAFFSNTFFGKLNALDEQHGAKKIIEKYPEAVQAVDFPGGEIDLDKIEDYYQFLKRTKNHRQ
jgi:molybdenum cofactor cytidylyltransferase